MSGRSRDWWQLIDTSGGLLACWPWQGGRNRDGYGVFGDGRGGNRLVHRRMAAETQGSIAGVIIRHTCDRPDCCNPLHLVRGTDQDNVADRVARGRSARGERVAGAKLTQVQVDEIRRRWAAREETQRAMARRFGVDRSTIWRICTGRLW